MANVREQISVEALKSVRVLYKGDIYELAQLLLKVNDERDKASKRHNVPTISRHTVHGLAAAYSYLARVEFNQIIGVFEKHGLPLGASVEPAHDVAPQNRLRKD